MAEHHPVGFHWVIEAKERGAKVIHVDPRFTRTERDGRPARADPRGHRHRLPRRPRSTTSCEHERCFEEYVATTRTRPSSSTTSSRTPRTSAASSPGWDPETSAYDIDSWAYSRSGAAAGGEQGAARPGRVGRAGPGRPRLPPPARRRRPSRTRRSRTRRCVFQILRRHFARYTPEMVARDLRLPAGRRSCRSPRRCARTPGRERTAAICYAVGWTQHTIGVQIIRAAVDPPAAARQHRAPGRRDPRAARPRDHPGLDRHPDALQPPPRLPPDAQPARQRTDARQVRRARTARRRASWGDLPAYIVSLLKAWWGDAATAENDFGFDYLPRIDGDHSHYPMMLRDARRRDQGLPRRRAEPGRRPANARCIRKALAQARLARGARRRRDRDRLVLVALARGRRAGEVGTEDIKTEVFFLPAAALREKDGSFTNTQRLLQWHDKAVEPPGDCPL